MPQQIPLATRIMLGVSVLSLLGGLCCGGAGVIGYRQGLHTKPRPQELTLERLASEGYGDNAHVLITDFELLTDDYVIEQEAISGKWTKVWVPLSPAGANERGAFRVVLESDDVSNEESLERLAEQEKIQGRVDVNFSLASEERGLLEEGYPDAELDDLLVVEMVPLGHVEPGAGYSLVFAGFGGMLLLIGVATILVGKRLSRTPATPPPGFTFLPEQ